MGNFKVRVNSEAESKEAQELFFELGLRFVNVDDFEYPQWLAVTKPDGTFSNYSISKNIWHTCNPKETTLPELRDMVDPMKEYLVPQNAGGFMYKKAYQSKCIPDSWIEIPEGAEILTGLESDKFSQVFWKPSVGEVYQDGAFRSYNFHKSMSYEKYKSNWRGNLILWQREQDEPFLTPETTLNDQYAEIEEVRQTLNERQSQYGSFKGVADTTAALMDQFALGRMSNVQCEALHMICSKLARIANGDPNHVDSWHDIAGYATLVVDDLES